jgi:hypothetical protein
MWAKEGLALQVAVSGSMQQWCKDSRIVHACPLTCNMCPGCADAKVPHQPLPPSTLPAHNKSSSSNKHLPLARLHNASAVVLQSQANSNVRRVCPFGVGHMLCQSAHPSLALPSLRHANAHSSTQRGVRTRLCQRLFICLHTLPRRLVIATTPAAAMPGPLPHCLRTHPRSMACGVGVKTRTVSCSALTTARVRCFRAKC